jgi:hypothetical protein
MFRSVSIPCAAVVVAMMFTACASTAPCNPPPAPVAVARSQVTSPSDPCAENFKEMRDSIIQGKVRTRSADWGTATMEADDMIASFKARHHCAP